MGYSIKPSAKESNSESSLFCTKEAKDDTGFERFCSKIGGWYRPYDDLNQMTDVIDKLAKNFPNGIVLTITYQSIIAKQAFRDFIISTMPEES